MGEVYQARDTRLGRPVAIKFVSDELAADRTASERLEREARLTSLLNHPNIVTVYDVGELDGRPYIVMELVAGQSLHSALQWERLKPRRVIEIASQIADGLAVAHAAGIVHRDLKPRNIMLTTDGRAKIVDFGVGKTSRPSPGAEDPTMYARPSHRHVRRRRHRRVHGAGAGDQQSDRLPRGSVRAGRDHLRDDHGPARVQTRHAGPDDGGDRRHRAGIDRRAGRRHANRARDRCRAVSCQGSREPLRVDAGSGPGSPRDPLRDGRPHLAFQRRAQAGAASPMAMDGGSWPCCSPWRRLYRSSSPIGRGPRSRRHARCSIASTSSRTWIRPSACSRLLSRPARRITRLVPGWQRRTCGSSSTSRQTRRSPPGPVKRPASRSRSTSPTRRCTSCWP